MMTPYQERDDNLRTLGFASYDAYLRSDLWQSIRIKVLLGRGCAVCKSTATEVHHKGYSLAVLRGEIIASMVPVCRQCHSQIEFSPKGKRSLSQANDYLDHMIRTRGKTGRENLCPCGNQRKHNKRLCKKCLRLGRRAKQRNASAAARP